MRRIVALALAWLVCAPALAPAQAPETAAEPSVRVTGHTRQVAAGGQVQVDLRLTGLDRCTVRTAGARGALDVRAIASARITFRAYQRARTGRYPIRVSCHPHATAAVNVRVKGTRTGPKRLLASPALVQLTPQDQAAGEKLVPVEAAPPPGLATSRSQSPQPPPRPQAADAAQAAEAAAYATARWALHGAAYEAQFRQGECTDLAQRRRPDVVRTATLAIWHDEYLGGTFDGSGWVAHAWDDNARYAGLPTGTVPRTGAIAVFEPGVSGTGVLTGHVAVVEEVLPDGRFRTSDMNVGGPFLTASFVRSPAPGISFVY